MDELQERLQQLVEMMKNPCEEWDHDYKDIVYRTPEGTMLNVVCSKCMDVRGWIFN
jgi:hypothetical protein